MTTPKTGEKGLMLEELLKAYFLRAGYFVIRGVPYRLGSEDITDIDLWLYERPGASTRRRIIVDIKNKKSPKAAERLIWTKGLQNAISVDSAIVATTARSDSARKLAKNLGVVLLDGDAISKLTQSDSLIDESILTVEMLEGALKSLDQARRSTEWRAAFFDARASLIEGFGIRSANTNLAVTSFFAEQAILAQENSGAAELATRLMYFASSLVAVSLDFFMADHVFRAQEDRRQIVVDGLRFGQTDELPAVATIKTAIGLARQYADNGPTVARQIENAFYKQAERIPAEIIADYVIKITGRDTLFSIARELEAAAFSGNLFPFDGLSTETKSFLGVLLDFNGMPRDKIAAAWRGGSKSQMSPVKKHAEALESDGPLFSKHQKEA